MVLQLFLPHPRSSACTLTSHQLSFLIMKVSNWHRQATFLSIGRRWNRLWFIVNHSCRQNGRGCRSWRCHRLEPPGIQGHGRGCQKRRWNLLLVVITSQCGEPGLQRRSLNIVRASRQSSRRCGRVVIKGILLKRYWDTSSMIYYRKVPKTFQRIQNFPFQTFKKQYLAEVLATYRLGYCELHSVM